MKVSDLEYTRVVIKDVSGATSEFEDVNFAVGLSVRPLLTRVQATYKHVGVATQDGGVWMENAQNIPAGNAVTSFLLDTRTPTLLYRRHGLVTSGVFHDWGPQETLWWKLLQPQFRLHFVGGTASDDFQVVLHYRFAELTGDEIIDLAAQRAQD